MKKKKKIIECKDIKGFYDEGEYFEVGGGDRRGESGEGKGVCMEGGG
ncbi:hypothetical protein [Staphylococcus epidermidis]|nr:hypothetical protein [Staphylococcus epidermidis]